MCIKIGLVGFGRMGREHAKQIDFISGVEIGFIIEPSPENRELARQKYANTNVQIFTDLTAVLGHHQVDGWIVTSSTKSHIEIARALLIKQQKVLLEKPLAITGAQALEIRDLVKDGSSNLMLGHILLWSREFKAFLEEAQKRGKITSIHASRQRPEAHREIYLGEPLFSIVMVHDFYCIQTLMHGVEPTTFDGETKPNISVGDDFSMAQLGWEDNASALIEANYLLPTTPFTEAIDEISATGEGWYANLRYGSGVITVLNQDGLRDIPIGGYEGEGIGSYFDEALRSEINDFCSLLRGKIEVPFGARYQDACQVQGWIDRLIASSREDH
jgi:predicted dehydrogenase